jgi:hypothetical protein
MKNTRLVVIEAHSTARAQNQTPISKEDSANQSHGITRIIGCLALGGVLCTSVAQCQVYLVGANTFPTAASGAWINNGFTETTDANNGGHTTLHVNGSGYAGMSLLLTPGVNTIQFISDLNESAGFSAGYVGMNLFLNGTGTSFNPITGPNPGTLTITGHAGSPTFFVDAGGTSILSYDSGLSGTMANGATSFTVNGQTVTVTGFTVSSLGTSGFPVGTLTLYVTPAPAPEPSYKVFVEEVCITTNSSGNLVYKPFGNEDFIKQCASEKGITNLSGLSLVYNRTADALQVVMGTNVICTPLTFAGGTYLVNSNHTKAEDFDWVYVETNTVAAGTLVDSERFFYDTNNVLTCYKLCGQLQYTVPDGTNGPAIYKGQIFAASPGCEEFEHEDDNDQGENNNDQGVMQPSSPVKPSLRAGSLPSY